MLTPARLLVRLDAGNALFDNGRLCSDPPVQPDHASAYAERERYGSFCGVQHNRYGGADYLVTLKEFLPVRLSELATLTVSSFLLVLPFNERMYCEAFTDIGHLRMIGTTIIHSVEGVVFKLLKIQFASMREETDNQYGSLCNVPLTKVHAATAIQETS